MQGDGYYHHDNEAAFEDGTLDYLNLPAVEAGLQHVERVGIESIDPSIAPRSSAFPCRATCPSIIEPLNLINTISDCEPANTGRMVNMAMKSEPLRIALVSPKGPLYRRRGGIFKQSLRYMPLTLPTLASLVPDDLNAEVVCIDEGIHDVDVARLDADIVGLTVITGTASRAYELSAALRQRGITTVLGGPHVTLVPDDSQPHADSIVVGYAEEEWPRLLRDFVRGELQPRYTQSPDLDLANAPLPDRSVLPRRKYLTADVFEATRSCIHNCDFCVAPSAWGRKPLNKPVADVVTDMTRRKAKRAVFVDLNLISNRSYATELFTALKPLGIDLPRFAIVTPFPGTPLYHRLESEDRIFDRNWENYDGQHVVFQPAKLSIEELQSGTETAWKHAYCWRGIASRLRRTAAPWHVAALTNLGYRHYAHNLHRFYNCDWMWHPDSLRPKNRKVA